MKKISLEQVLQATGAQLVSKKSESFWGIGTDTRADLSKALFVALKGDSFDAHEFLPKALQAGATGLLIHQPLDSISSLSQDQKDELKKNLTIFLVKDTLKALQDLAHHSRLQSGALIVGITGSNGKTTSKEFAGAVISSKKKVHQPKGSFNNHWGVPITLLAEPEGTEVSLIEMGMNHEKEIQRLCEIANPDIVVVSMVGRAHIEHFGTIEKIALAKREIYDFAKPEAIRIFNLDNPWTLKMYQEAKKLYPKSRQFLTLSSSQEADVQIRIKELTMADLLIEGQIKGVSGSARVPVFGAQNLTNLMVAASLGISVGMSPQEVWSALPRCRTSWGRNQLVKLKSGAELMFDGYNANPDSMKALIENLNLLKCEGKKIGVFGQMKELGDQSAQLHRELGELVALTDLEVVCFFGDDAVSFEAGMKAKNFKKNLYVSNTYEESLASKVASVINPKDTLVVKGSRGMKLERFVIACEPENFSLKKED